MSRKLRFALFLLSLSCLGVLILSCGGSSSGSGGGGCTGGPYNVVGNWTLNVTGTSGSASGPGVIDSSGSAVFFQTTTTQPAPGDTVVLPKITGACSFSGTAVAYGTPASGGGSATNTVTGSVTSASAINGTLSNGNSFSLTPSPLSGAFMIPPGNFFAIAQGATTLEQFGISFSGNSSSLNLSGSDNFGCTVSGTLTAAGASNVFDASLTFSGSMCATTTSINGVAFESGTDYFGFSGNPQITGTYVYVVSSSSAFVFEIFPAPIAL